MHNVFAEMALDVSAMAAEAEARSKSRGDELISELQRLAHDFQVALEVQRTRCRPAAIADLVAIASRAQDFTLLVIDPESAEQRDLARWFCSARVHRFLPSRPMTCLPISARS